MEEKVKIRKTCGTCQLFDSKHEICRHSDFFVHAKKSRPNCKQWKLVEGKEPELIVPTTHGVPTEPTAMELATALPPIPKIIMSAMPSKRVFMCG